MNVLLMTVGSAGDVHPFVGLGMALKRRGHAVTVVTNEFFKPLVLNAGLEFIGIGTAEDYRAVVENPELWHPRRGFELLVKWGILGLMRQEYQLIRDFGCRDTVVAASGLVLGARIAQEKLTIPLVTVALQPSMFWKSCRPPVFAGLFLPLWLPSSFKLSVMNYLDRILDKMLASETNAFRGELGLPAVRSIYGSWMLSPQKIIGLFPDWFAPPAPDWPPQAQLTGFISFDDAREDSVSAAVEDFLKTGEPPLIFTPGTAMHHAAGFFSASLEACRLLGRRALLLTGNRSQLPSSLPAGVMHCPYLPFSKILPRGAALVHHGGIGTTAQALAAGIPQLVMPMAYDQPDNAARTERLGVGASISPARYRGPAVAKKLSYLLASLEVKARCGIYAAKIEYARAIEDACVAIEGVVAR